MEREAGSGSVWGRFRAGATWQSVTLAVMALAGVATLVALALILVGANRQRDAALRAQAHSYDVMILARALAGTIARAEASLGRYVISTDGSLGQTYSEQWNRAAAQLERLDAITDDNAEQQPRIDALRRAFDARGKELSLTALATSYHRNLQALARYYAARRGASLAEIDARLEDIIAHERALLAQRTAAATRGVERASRIAGALASLAIVLVIGGIGFGWLAVNEAGERRAARADADAASARADELSIAIATATDELRAQEAKLRQGQKMEAVGQLTGGIAHDFNNMLAVVIGGLELAQRHLAGNPDAAARHLDNAREGAERAAALTRRLLAFSREESLKPEAIEPAALVRGMSELLDRTLGDAITVETHDEGQGWCVRADRVQLENAVLNLAVNARDAMDGRGRLTIATATRTLAEHEIDHCRAGDYAMLTVRDTGCGMTPEIAERVFEPFFTTKEAGKGTGLGLSQIFALVRQLGGEIAIDTAPGHGTAVMLFLPRDLTASVGAGAPVVVPASAAISTSALTVLVVEDDPRVLTATVGALEELGHRTIPCSDPLAAPALLADTPAIGLIVSDVLMPGQTGPEMVARLPAPFAALPVLFVTGFAGEAAAGGFEGRAVLRKPFTLVGLERAIDEAVRARPAEAAVAVAAE